MRSLALLACVALGACSFSPPTAGPTDGPPADEVTIPPDEMTVPPDEMPPPDARLCFGDGLGMVCLMAPPMTPRTLSGTIDTGVDASCDEIIDVTGTPACVIAGTTVTVEDDATFRATGSRPLVIVASEALTVEGEINVGSVRGGSSGAGAANMPCAGTGAPENDGGGGGGGAGGSHSGKGGNGGVGDLNNSNNNGGQASGGTSAAELTLTQLRAGCRGGSGGNATGNGGSGGRGGGAVYLTSGVQIEISGRIFAFGAGGNGGGVRAGGGGGGSGGMIGLDAPIVTVSGEVVANGGGGGEGGGFQAGAPGADGTVNATRATGGVAPNNDGSDNDGGNGGLGSGGVTLTGGGGANHAGGGGGGGGGAGFIYVKGTANLSGVISPAASVN